MDVIDGDDRARPRRRAGDLRYLRLLRPASAVCAHVSSTPGRERPARPRPGPPSAARYRVAHALLRVLAPSAIARAGGTPRRPLSSRPSRYQSGPESLTTPASERSARTTGHRHRLDRSPRLRTTARTHVVPLFVLSYCKDATPTIAPSVATPSVSSTFCVIAIDSPIGRHLSARQVEPRQPLLAGDHFDAPQNVHARLVYSHVNQSRVVTWLVQSDSTASIVAVTPCGN
jgi:hypothetical protein